MTWLVDQGPGKSKIGKPDKNVLGTNHMGGFMKVGTKCTNLCIVLQCPPETSTSNAEETHDNQKEGLVRSTQPLP